jgi:hypothetical protein
VGNRPPGDAAMGRYQEQVERLSRHPLYGAIRSRAALRIFMEHHVYAVWDFMSLIKALQQRVAPPAVPWTPPQNGRLAAYINQLVLDEESDLALGGVSHFEFYCRAMAEIGADCVPVRQLIERARREDVSVALDDPHIPEPSRRFVRFTFEIIARGQPHRLAALLAYGRETVIPDMFQALLTGAETAAVLPPSLHRYLERHIELDSDAHGPLSMLLVEEFCKGNERHHAEVMETAVGAVTARLELWDHIYERVAAAG